MFVDVCILRVDPNHISYRQQVENRDQHPQNSRRHSVLIVWSERGRNPDVHDRLTKQAAFPRRMTELQRIQRVVAAWADNYPLDPL